MARRGGTRGRPAPPRVSQPILHPGDADRVTPSLPEGFSGPPAAPAELWPPQLGACSPLCPAVPHPLATPGHGHPREAPGDDFVPPFLSPRHLDVVGTQQSVVIVVIFCLFFLTLLSVEFA